MAKGFIPPDTALVQSISVLAVFGKLVLLQTIAVLGTDLINLVLLFHVKHTQKIEKKQLAEEQKPGHRWLRPVKS